jgi:cell division protein FtsW
MKWTYGRFDPALFIMSIAASIAGWIFIFDAGYARSLRIGLGAIPREFLMQVAWLPIAVGVGFAVSRVKVETLARWGKPLWWTTVALLLAVLLLGIGYEMNGAHRWFRIGPVTLQPAEFAKVTAILYVAAILATRKRWPAKIKPSRSFDSWMGTVAAAKFKRLWPAIAVLIGVGLIAIEPDMGTAAVVAVVAWVMFAVGRTTLKSMAIVTMLGLVMGWLVMKAEPYRMERINQHATRWSSSQIDDTGYQTVQAELGAAAGGFGGVGFTAGRVKHVIPAPTTDFIPATIAEELGLFGWLIVAGLLAAITVRLFQLAQRSSTSFGAYVLVGTGAWIGIQSVVNLSMANGTLPAIGIPLPFISSGGSSLVALWMALGISQAAMQPAAERAKEVEIEVDRHGWRDRRARVSGA